jgi:serine/threonine protein kinase
MLRALHYCHNVIKVYHRDIKPDNIMVNHNYEAVLIDFGVSTLMEDIDLNDLKNNL